MTEVTTIYSKKCTIIMYVGVAIVVFIVAIVSVTLPKKECSIDIIEDLTVSHPLLLHTDSLEFILPTFQSKISLKAGEKLRLACAGQNNYFLRISLPVIEATCIDDKIFLVGNAYYIFEKLQCIKPTETSVKVSENKCSEKYTQIDIGYDTKTGFVNLISSCFDDVNKNSLYSIHNLSPRTNYTQKVDNPLLFEQGEFYGAIDVNKLYQATNQQIIFKQITGTSVINMINRSKYFNRGHLAPKGDFIYAFQKLSTFHFVNVAPQWNTFNAGNWEKLESSCRKFAIIRNLNLKVFTGVYGQSQLQRRYISLHLDKNNNKLLAVPKIYWKILYDANSGSATVFITHNNPYEIATKICTDVCYKIEWLSWQPTDKNAGISYCCEYAEVKRIVGHFPDIPVIKLLT